MAILFDDDPAGLFRRLGKLFGMSNDIRTHQTDLVTEVDDVLDKYAAARDYAFQLQQGLDGFIATAGAPLTIIQQVARRTLIEQINADNPLTSKTLENAMIELIAQMAANSETVDGTTVSAAVNAGASNTGNGTVLYSLTDGAGNALVNVRAEDIVLTCTRDAQESGTAGQETFSVRGEEAISNNLDKDWPAGSGINSSATVKSPSVDTLLTNADFEDFTTNAPDDWTIDTGSAGTTVDDTTTAYRGSKALQFIGNGSQLTKISQAVTLKPRTRYALWFRVRDDGTGPAAGVLRVSLRDGSNNEIGSSNISVDLTTVGSSYTLQSITLATPLVLPSGLKIVIELTTALTNTRAVFIDDVGFFEMQQYGAPGGPFLTVIPGSTAFIRDDVFTVTITNNNEGEFVREFDRFFDMYRLGLYLPQNTAGSETIADTLIS